MARTPKTPAKDRQKKEKNHNRGLEEKIEGYTSLYKKALGFGNFLLGAERGKFLKNSFAEPRFFAREKTLGLLLITWFDRDFTLFYN